MFNFSVRIVEKIFYFQILILKLFSERYVRYFPWSSSADGSAHEFGFGPSSSCSKLSKQPDKPVTDREPEVMEEDEDDNDDHHMELSKSSGGDRRGIREFSSS